MNVFVTLIATFAASQSAPWTPMAPVPAPGVKSGPGLVAAGNDALYTILGYDYFTNNPAPFCRYRPSTNEWSTMAPAPIAVKSGSSMAHIPGSNHIYVEVGGGGYPGPYLLRYSIGSVGGETADTWAPYTGTGSLSPLPCDMHYGARLAATGSKIYAFGGANDGFSGKSFWEFDPTIPTNGKIGRWTRLTDLPTLNGAMFGAGLAWMPGTNHIYATTGGDDTSFLRYAVATVGNDSGNSWTVLQNVPMGVTMGGSLAVVPPAAIYCITGQHKYYAEATSSPLLRFDLNPSAPGGGAWAAVTELAPTPYPISDGGGIAYPGSGPAIYCLRGVDSTDGLNPPTTGFCRSLCIDMAPDAPSALGQSRMDGRTSITVNGFTRQPFFSARAILVDPNEEPVKLQVEIQECGIDFTEAVIHTGEAVPSGSVASVTVPLPAGKTCHWQARSIDARGAKLSAWVSFGANIEPGGIDIERRANAAPVLDAASLVQAKPDGRRIPAGGQCADGIVFEGAVSDADGETVAFEVEVRRVGETFSGSPSAAADFAPSGTRRVNMAGLSEGALHWQARAIDDWGLASAWAPYGGNAESEPDFQGLPAGSANNVKGCHASGAATALLLALAVLLPLRR